MMMIVSFTQEEEDDDEGSHDFVSYFSVQVKNCTWEREKMEQTRE